MGRSQARSAFAAAVVLSCGLAAPVGAVVDVSGPDHGIAVVAFATGSSTDGTDLPDVASLLAGALSARWASRVVTPASLLRDDRGLDDPQAVDVRRWALWNDVANVVVGRTSTRGRRIDVAIELRSGHSGGARAEYRLAPKREDLPRAVARLAGLILADLGATDRSTTDGLPPVAAGGPAGVLPAVEAEGSDEESSSAGGIEMALLPGTRRDDPISINSEELEVLPDGSGRRLIFSRNVEVLQGDVSLNADRLEAVYLQGASQPQRLLASGSVRVSQGDRRARCDEAVYERGPHTIVCRGRAEVLQGCDRVRGEEIEFDLERERIRVTGAASVVIASQDADAGECLAEGRPQ